MVFFDEYGTEAETVDVSNMDRDGIKQLLEKHGFTSKMQQKSYFNVQRPKMKVISIDIYDLFRQQTGANPSNEDLQQAFILRTKQREKEFMKNVCGLKENVAFVCCLEVCEIFWVESFSSF
eukprot:TRINITY_DN1379_c0_g1_i4.p1 TRINITY_DN1379_c0_g1~~TRINITY_DN1379_c0_g1_i4.p1  ORF type:complete len:121 (-),score=20.33 TRINITY_DN1379_c0_g1_i4:326-688(-)